MKATSSRRQLIVFVLLGLALAGAAMRQWSGNPSLARDIGTLLLVLWLPIIGNVVAFVITRVHRARRTSPAAGFAPDAAFTPHLLVEVTAAGARAPALSNEERNCTLVVGHEGFTARAADAPGAMAGAGAQRRPSRCNCCGRRWPCGAFRWAPCSASWRKARWSAAVACWSHAAETAMAATPRVRALREQLAHPAPLPRAAGRGAQANCLAPCSGLPIRASSASTRCSGISAMVGVFSRSQALASTSTISIGESK